MALKNSHLWYERYKYTSTRKVKAVCNVYLFILWLLLSMLCTQSLFFPLTVTFQERVLRRSDDTLRDGFIFLGASGWKCAAVPFWIPAQSCPHVEQTTQQAINGSFIIWFETNQCCYPGKQPGFRTPVCWIMIIWLNITLFRIVTVIRSRSWVHYTNFIMLLC